MVICPVCGRKFTDRGYLNHVRKCKGMSGMEKETIRRIRKLSRNK